MLHITQPFGFVKPYTTLKLLTCQSLCLLCLGAVQNSGLGRSTILQDLGTKLEQNYVGLSSRF